MAGTLNMVFAHGADPFRGRGRLNFPDSFVTVERDSANPFEVDVVIAAGAGGSLQSAYDGGEAIQISAARGPVELNVAPIIAQGLVLQFTSADPGVSGPSVLWFHDSATPAAGDFVGTLRFDGRNDGGTQITYAEIQGKDQIPTNPTEEGRIQINTMAGGVLGRTLQIFGMVLSGTDHGCVFRNSVAAPGTAFEFRAANNLGVGDPVLFVRDSDGATTLFRVDGDGKGTLPNGDIDAVGGYKMELGHFVKTDVTIPVTDEVMSLFTSGNLYTVKQTTFAGSIIGMSIRLSVPVDPGDTLTIDVTLDGAKVFSTTMVAADGTEKTVTQARDTDIFAVNQSIGVLYSTNVGFGPAGLDVQVQVIVEQ